MLSIISQFPEWFQIYLLVGGIVFLIVWKSFAYRGANRASGSILGHAVSSYRDRGITPTWFDCLLCLVWFPPMVIAWPLILFIYISGNNCENK